VVPITWPEAHNDFGSAEGTERAYLLNLDLQYPDAPIRPEGSP